MKKVVSISLVLFGLIVASTAYAQSADCVIPASGPWPACARGGGNITTAPSPSVNNNTNCVIPESGPWPPCATQSNNNQPQTQQNNQWQQNQWVQPNNQWQQNRWNQNRWTQPNNQWNQNKWTQPNNQWQPKPTWVAPTPQPTSPPPQVSNNQNCHPSYPGVCIPAGPDLDCNEVPYSNFRVLQPDPHRFDRDKDGIGCES